MIRKILTLLFLLTALASFTFATHNRAGEITYRQISAYTYEITIVTYTYTPSQANEYRDVLPVYWGDGEAEEIPRITEQYLPDSYTKNTYVARHTYPGAGVYSIVMIDFNRNDGVKNIFDSVNIPFSITTTLKIDPILGGNNTPVLLNPPVDKAALGERFVHNPAAYDIDGDSLSYALTVCTGQDGEPIFGYDFPAASKEFRVDSVNGDLIWDAPTQTGSFNVAMLVEEWRSGIKIGQVERDIQIEVYDTENHTPSFTTLPSVCVRAGDTVKFTVTATDVDGQNMSLTARGGPLEVTSSKASFANSTGFGTVSSEFFWIPSCNEVREQPYQVVFKAQDYGASISLSALQYVNINVIGYAPVNITAEPSAVSVALAWDDTLCNNQIGYDIYRSTVSQNYTHQYCETGMPSDLSEYKLIASVDSSQHSFVDNNNAIGLSPGFTYCYRMLSKYKDDFPSFVSEEVCVELIPSFPVITNVSVLQTDCDTGSIYIAWSKAREFDAIKYPEPYQYRLFRSSGITQSDLRLIATINGLNDTTFVDTDICTQDSIYSYQVAFYTLASGEPQLIGMPPVSTSPFVSAVASDQTITLSLTAQVSWINDSLYVFRKSPLAIEYDSIGIFNGEFFVDSGLVNLQEYCYYIKTSGYFNYDSLPKRVYNYSQIVCAQPIDSIPPEPISFTVIQDCENQIHTLYWDSIQDGISKFSVYFKSCESREFSLLQELPANVYQTSHRFENTDVTMSGCYYVTATDAMGNESAVDTTICMYTCPKYILPNIFTPNNDGENEIYKPALNQYVQKVDMKIYDSWGQLVFESANPELLWDGTHQQSGKTLNDGVFYYVCDVYEYWNTCEIKPRVLVGFIHKFSEGKQ